MNDEIQNYENQENYEMYEGEKSESQNIIEEKIKRKQKTIKEKEQELLQRRKKLDAELKALKGSKVKKRNSGIFALGIICYDNFFRKIKTMEEFQNRILGEKEITDAEIKLLKRIEFLFDDREK